MIYTITHSEVKHRFETNVDGHEATVEYDLRDSTIIILRTWVPQPIEGRGIAAALTEYALEYAMQNRLKVIPSCSYTRIYILKSSRLFV